MCIRDRLKRVCRESIIVKELHGLDFSLNGVFGGDLYVFRKDESAFDVDLGDKRSVNSCPWIFCAPDRWCENKVVVPYAKIGRENVAWCDRERCSKSERYCERKREVEIFKICRNCEEFIERLGGERSENNSKYLPCNETEVVGDYVDNNNDLIKYLIMTNYTKGDWTIPVSYTHLPLSLYTKERRRFSKSTMPRSPLDVREPVKDMAVFVTNDFKYTL